MSASEMVGHTMRLCVGMKKIQTFVAVALWFVGPVSVRFGPAV